LGDDSTCSRVSQVRQPSNDEVRGSWFVAARRATCKRRGTWFVVRGSESPLRGDRVNLAARRATHEPRTTNYEPRTTNSQKPGATKCSRHRRRCPALLRGSE